MAVTGAGQPRVFYNEIDRYCCDWLSNLMDAGHIRPGVICDRSIADLTPEDVRGYDIAHFFAGIGGWDLGLTMAGWRHTPGRVVWTGSCPCQPFSAAGKRKGVEDERHLWPEFRRLIAECNPAVVFGEQVASKDGRVWLAGVRTDLEALGYAVGAADLCAAGVGAPHIRQRLWWVADAEREQQHGRGDARPGGWSEFADGSDAGRLGDADDAGPQGRGRAVGAERAGERAAGADGASFWGRAEWIACADGKARRVEPGIQPLAHGVSARVGKLRAAGNAIVSQVAAEFIGAWMEGRH